MIRLSFDDKALSQHAIVSEWEFTSYLQNILVKTEHKNKVINDKKIGTITIQGDTTSTQNFTLDVPELRDDGDIPEDMRCWYIGSERGGEPIFSSNTVMHCNDWGCPVSCN